MAGERLTLLDFTHANPGESSLVPRVKEFLTRFGYLERIFEPEAHLDSKTISAIQHYQRFYHLKVTSTLSDQFIEHIATPRCARSDYFLLKGDWADPVPLCFTLSGRKWLRCKVRYRFNNPPPGFSRSVVLNVIQEVLDNWVSAASLGFSFEEAAVEEQYELFIDWVPPSSVPNLNLAVLGCYGYGEPPPDGGGLLSQTMSRMLFPADQPWDLLGDQEKFDIRTVVNHEVGHILGLEHCSGSTAMNPNIPLGVGFRLPQGNDILQVAGLYQGVVCM